MATLPDQHHHLFFQITPLPPSLEGPHNAYNVTVRAWEQVLYERQYTTYAEGPDGHWNVWRLFRMLQLAEELADSETPFSLTGRQDGLFHEPTKLTVEIGWLNAVLCSDTVTHQYKRPELLEEKRISLIFYLLTGPQEMGITLGDYRQFFLACRPVDVVAFGQALEAECREALRLRREMGVLAPADDYVDD